VSVRCGLSALGTHLTAVQTVQLYTCPIRSWGLLAGGAEARPDTAPDAHPITARHTAPVTYVERTGPCRWVRRRYRLASWLELAQLWRSRDAPAGRVLRRRRLPAAEGRGEAALTRQHPAVAIAAAVVVGIERRSESIPTVRGRSRSSGGGVLGAAAIQWRLGPVPGGGGGGGGSIATAAAAAIGPDPRHGRAGAGTGPLLTQRWRSIGAVSQQLLGRGPALVAFILRPLFENIDGLPRPRVAARPHLRTASLVECDRSVYVNAGGPETWRAAPLQLAWLTNPATGTIGDSRTSETKLSLSYLDHQIARSENRLVPRLLDFQEISVGK